MDLKSFGKRNKQWAYHRQKHFPFSLRISWLSLKYGFGGCNGLDGLSGFNGLGGFDEFNGFGGFVF